MAPFTPSHLPPRSVPDSKGLLGGFALLNFYVTYLVYPLEISATAIEYYAPPADLFARVYLAFINLALIASVARCEAGHMASGEAELRHLNGAVWV